MSFENYLNKKHFLTAAIILPVIINIFYLCCITLIPVTKFGMEENYFYKIQVYSHFPNIPSDAIVDIISLKNKLGYCPAKECNAEIEYSKLNMSEIPEENRLYIEGRTDLYINLDNNKCGTMNSIMKQYPDSKLYRIEHNFLGDVDRRFPGYALNIFQIVVRKDVSKNNNNELLRNTIEENCDIIDPNFNFSLNSKDKIYGK